MKKTTCPTTPLCGARLFVPTTIDECLSYQQKQEFMWKKIEELESRILVLESKVV